jgi:hypothetical protein
VIGHRTAQRRPLCSDAVRSRKLSLIVILLALLLALAGCASTPEPPAETAAVPVTSTMVTAPVAVASPSTPKPTATFVPLITPSPTPEGGALTNSIVPRIELGVAKEMADAGEAVLVDVRTKATFDQAHIAGAVSMPSSEVLDRYHELPTDKLVIFY